MPARGISLTLTTTLRSREGPVLAGVCFRLGARYGIDPFVLRIGFAIATLVGGGGVIAYAVLAVVLRTDPELLDRRPGRRTWMVAAGIGLIVLSVLLTLRALGLWWSDAVVWPVVLTAAGVAILWQQS